MEIEELGVLFLKYRRDAVRVASKTYVNIDEDTMDQLYADLWPAISKNHEARYGGFKMKSLLITALKNKCKDYIRNSLSSDDVMDRCPMFSLSDPEVIEEADKHCYSTRANDPTLDLHDEEANDRYLMVMSGLPETLRLVAELYYIDGCTQEEIACHLSTHQVKIHRLLSRATKQLKRRYSYVLDQQKKGHLCKSLKTL